MNRGHGRHRWPKLLLTAVLLLGATAGSCGQARDTAEGRFEPVTPGVLKVATALPAPGFWEGDTPTTVEGGFEWAVAEALADRFDLRLEVIDVAFQRLVLGDFGGADLAIAQISITEDRRESLGFSVPYYTTGAGVLAAEGAEIRDLRTARRQRWAVVAGTTEARFVAEVVRPIDDTLVVDTETEAARAVTGGTVDAALMDLPTALVIAARTVSLDTVARFETIEQYAVALHPEAPPRNLQVVDAGIRALEGSGALGRFAREWLIPAFETDPSAVPVIRAR
jgi:polar amino acid transport system substrate-binding protein